MADFLFITAQVLAVFMAFLLAYIVRKLRKDTIDLASLSEIILYIGSPCLVLSKIATTSYETSELLLLFGAMFFFIAGVAFFNFIYSKATGKKLSSIFYVATMFMNTANVGFPVTLFVLGEAAFQKAIILDLAMILFLFSLGVGIITGKYSDILKMPVLYAAALGFFINFSHIHLPTTVYKPLFLLGELTVPVMIVSLGCKLADLKGFKFSGLPVLATFIRSGIGFLLAWIYVVLFQIDGVSKDVILLYGALPGPIMSYILAQKFNKDEETAAQIVFASNLSAVVILPIVIYVIKYYL